MQPDYGDRLHPGMLVEPVIDRRGKMESLAEIVNSYYRRTKGAVRACAAIGEFTHGYLGYFPRNEPIDFKRPISLFFPQVLLFPEQQPTLHEILIDHLHFTCTDEEARHYAQVYMSKIRQIDNNASCTSIQ
ncbi:hypothetical protein RYA05_04000 [Pseudomonas syringae pv. actinidiae]|nr:hypothetical protein [Pseudomonas syringae pv. actinidiae]